jgi:hypothetical protein
MDEIPGMPPAENFFDDGDDHILGRIDEGENAAGYDLVEVSGDELEDAVERDNRANGVDGGPNVADDYDWRMVGRGEGPRAPKGLHAKSENTGPKGVKRDYEIAKQNQAIKWRFEAMRKERAARQMSSQMSNLHTDGDGSAAEARAAALSGDSAFSRDAPRHVPTRFSGGEDDDAAQSSKSAADDMRNRRIQALKAAAEQQREEQQQQRGKSSAGGDSGDDLDSDEEAAFQRYKADRIRAVQASMPTFGSYVRAQRFDELAELIKGAHELQRTIVHVYENTSRACVSLHLTFEAMAPLYPHVAFIRVRSSEAMGSGYDAKGLPTLLLYKADKLATSLIAAATVLGETPSDAAVAEFLAKHGMLAVPTGGTDAITRRRRAVWDEGNQEASASGLRVGGTAGGAVGAAAAAAQPSNGTRAGVGGRAMAAALDSDDDFFDRDDD